MRKQIERKAKNSQNLKRQSNSPDNTVALALALTLASTMLCGFFTGVSCFAAATGNSVSINDAVPTNNAGLENSVQPASGIAKANGVSPKKKRTRKQISDSASPIMMEISDPMTAVMSPDAVQLADLLGITAKLRRLVQLNKELDSAANNSTNRELRDERADLRFDVLEAVEESRLQIDCVQSEIEEEVVVLEEARRLIFDERDKRVNSANQAAFRTNGVLWAVAEALDIPTYKSPKLSISSGSIGIMAGIVPSLFSGYATRSSSGGQYKRKVYPNILTKMFDLPAIPRVDYPGVVWLYLNSNPPGETRSRREIIVDHWRVDSYIHFFEKGQTRDRLLLLTGNEPYIGDLNLVSDKLIMMAQIKAITLQMSRPLLEICMVTNGSKHFAQ